MTITELAENRFGALPEPYRKQALDNFKRYKFKQLPETFATMAIKDVLFCAFAWKDTPEGYEYWEDVYRQLS